MFDPFRTSLFHIKKDYKVDRHGSIVRIRLGLGLVSG